MNEHNETTKPAMTRRDVLSAAALSLAAATLPATMASAQQKRPEPKPFPNG